MISVRHLRVALLSIVTTLGPALAQTPQQPPAAAPARPAHPTPPTRDPNTPGYVKAKELSDGPCPPAPEDENFILGPPHSPAPEMPGKEGVPQGAVIEFTMQSSESK